MRGDACHGPTIMQVQNQPDRGRIGLIRFQRNGGEKGRGEVSRRGKVSLHTTVFSRVSSSTKTLTEPDVVLSLARWT